MIITIGRQYGSGGRDIGQKVAQALGYKFYDKEILTLTAEREGFSVPAVRQYDEALTSSLLYGTYLSTAAGGADVLPLNQKLAIAQFDVVRRIAKDGNCVIVGRCADYILRDRKDCLHVFICSDMASRARRIVERYGQTQKAPEKRLAEKDQKRKVYYKNYTGRVWGQAQNYDICLNSGALGVDTCADMIVQLCK